jgi:hypothetical protein
MAHRILNNEGDLSAFTRFLGNLKLPLTVQWVQGRDRTKDQNSLQWLWATEAAEQLGDRTATDMQSEWKLRHGVPILREESAAFRDVYDRLLKPRSYVEKLAFMPFIDVTSAMKVRQMIRYLDAVQRECSENGIMLTEPDPELAAYQHRYRQKQAA